MSHDFISRYCGAPSQVEPKRITQQEVIDNFTNYIQKTCIQTNNIVRYSMPDKFIGLIHPDEFWSYIISFLESTMKFTRNSLLNYYSSGLLFESDYQTMAFKTFYTINQEKSSMKERYCTRNDNISYVIFRIYKSTMTESKDPEEIIVTKEDVIKDFKSYIKEKYINIDTIIEYRMPEKFVGKITKEDFWKIIFTFVSDKMNFECFDLGTGHFDDWELVKQYEELELNTYYTICEISNLHYPEIKTEALGPVTFDSLVLLAFRISNPII